MLKLHVKLVSVLAGVFMDYLVDSSGGEHDGSEGQQTVTLQQKTAERRLAAR